MEKNKKALKPFGFKAFYLVRVTGVEPAASRRYAFGRPSGGFKCKRPLVRIKRKKPMNHAAHRLILWSE